MTPPLDCCAAPQTTVREVLLRGPHEGLSVLACRCGAGWLVRMQEAIHWRRDEVDEIDLWYTRLRGDEADRLASGAQRSLAFLADRPSIFIDRRGAVQHLRTTPTKPAP